MPPARRWFRPRRSDKEIKGKAKATREVAAEVGKTLAERAKKAGVSGGRVRPWRLPVPWPGEGLADAAREGGLEF
jgi:large subunit ribosomal protein L18